ncbi:MAG: ADP-ribosylglycohydrolase family protein, partial [archaeon]
MEEMRHRFNNSLLCSAIGDALGMPIEGLSSDEIKNKYGEVRDYLKPPEEHQLHHLEPGQYSDDFQQTYMVANTIRQHYSFEIDEFVKEFTYWGEKNIEEEKNPRYWWRYP